MKLKPFLIGGLVLALVVAVAAWAASPIIAFEGLRRAAESGDRTALVEQVDFDSLRSSVKDQLDRKLEHLDEKKKHGILGALGGFFGAAVVDRAVDALVTPDTVAALVRNGKVPGLKGDKGVKTAEDGGKDGKTSKIEVDYAYTGINRFEATLSSPRHPEHAVVLVMRRHGLFGWKLSGVKIVDEPAGE